MVGLLWRHVVENIFRLGFVEIVGQPTTQVNEFTYGIIEYYRIEEMPVEMFHLTRLRIRNITSVSQQFELFHRHARHLKENLRRNSFIKLAFNGFFNGFCIEAKRHRSQTTAPVQASAV